MAYLFALRDRVLWSDPDVLAEALPWESPSLAFQERKRVRIKSPAASYLHPCSFVSSTP